MPPQKGIDRSNEKWTWQLEHCGMFWRYFVLEDMEIDDIAIFRDCDSRVSKREADAVNHWLDTNYLGHRIHENEAHWNAVFMGGMWGWRGSNLKGIKENIEAWIENYQNLNHPYIFIDLEWINNILGTIVINDMIGYGHRHPNPLPELKEGEYPVGWVEHDEWRSMTFNPIDYHIDNIGRI